MELLKQRLSLSICSLGHSSGKVVGTWQPCGQTPQTGSVVAAVKPWRARSRLYRNQILQVNMRLEALAEIYTVHSFAQLCNLKF